VVQIFELKMAGTSRGSSELGTDHSNHDVTSQPTKDESKEIVIECAICLQPSLFPVRLPCTHIFCFLCVKGISLQSKRCAMCRQEIPEDYIFNPVLVNPPDQEEGPATKVVATAQVDQEGGEEQEEEYQWFYKGRNGWWQYDLRTNKEIEKYHQKGDQRCELLIAGYLYVIDFQYMLQYRRNDPSRRRQVKRDKATQPKKGIAGLRLGGVDNCDNNTDDDSNTGPSAAEPASDSDNVQSDNVNNAQRVDINNVRATAHVSSHQSQINLQDSPNLRLQATESRSEELRSRAGLSNEVLDVTEDLINLAINQEDSDSEEEHI